MTQENFFYGQLQSVIQYEKAKLMMSLALSRKYQLSIIYINSTFTKFLVDIKMTA